jgi:hypothetical protein
MHELSRALAGAYSRRHSLWELSLVLRFAASGKEPGQVLGSALPKTHTQNAPTDATPRGADD